MIGNSAALLLVDMQPDFMPGGALAVSGGDRILEPIQKLMRCNAFSTVVATQDWHPPGHASFASAYEDRLPFDTILLHGREQVLWPDHCVQRSAGADLHPALPWERVHAIVRKGTRKSVDSYSGFRNNWDERGERAPTGLGGFLKELAIENIYICGLARDFCVKWTAEDAADFGFATAIVWDCTRSVDPSQDDGLRRELLVRGIAIVDSDKLLAGA